MSNTFMNLLFWLFSAHCAYQMVVAIKTKVVLGFGGRGSVVPVYLSYDDSPIGYFVFLGFYVAMSFGAFLVFLRWIRNR